MKLRNKKTGEILGSLGLFIIQNPNGINCETITKYDSLAKLNEEWEDYEEPKYFWFIDPEVLIACESTEPLLCDKKVAIETMKQIGNYFETKEEAEKVVEKLKALKVLNDNGFRFIDWEFDMKTVADGKIWFDVGRNTVWDAEELLKLKPEVKESLDFLFGGKE